MKHLLSFYAAPITNKKPSGEVELCDLHKYITTDARLQEATATVRAAYEAVNMEQYKQAKIKLLPYVTPAGVFTEAKNSGLVYANGLIGFDVDKLPSHEAACKLRDRLFEDQLLQVRLAFVSPSGCGVKLFVPYELAVYLPFENHYRNMLERVWFYMESIYDVEPDRACKDIARACFLCHDPEAKYRSENFRK
jgi:hypothetical protein